MRLNRTPSWSAIGCLLALISLGIVGCEICNRAPGRGAISVTQLSPLTRTDFNVGGSGDSAAMKVPVGSIVYIDGLEECDGGLYVSPSAWVSKGKEILIETRVKRIRSGWLVDDWNFVAVYHRQEPPRGDMPVVGKFH